MATDQQTTELTQHLECLGYNCVWQPNGWLHATHPTRWDFFLRPADVGVQFEATIHIGPLSDSSRGAWLKFLNCVNVQSHLAQFALVLDTTGPTIDYAVRARALVPGEYRRRQFGICLDMWHRDLDLIRDADSLVTYEGEEEAQQPFTVN